MDRATGREEEPTAAPIRGEVLSPVEFDAVVFDLDGVITDTASAHFEAWKEIFDNFLRASQGRDYIAFSKDDYRRYVDGKPRLDGIRSFLDSRGISLPEGEELSPGQEDHTQGETVLSLGDKKNEAYLKKLESGQIQVFDESVELVRQLLRKGIKTALVSSSKNAGRVLEILDLEPLFDVRVDGKTLDEEGLSGKPAPDLFVEAITRLGVTADRAAAVEDAESGVAAARDGGFKLVIGVDQNETRQRALLESGADIAVDHLGRFLTTH